MKDKVLDLISTPLFTIIFKKDKQGKFIIEELKALQGFTDLPINVQDDLVNEFMLQLGEAPTHRVGGSAKSC